MTDQDAIAAERERLLTAEREREAEAEHRGDQEAAREGNGTAAGPSVLDAIKRRRDELAQEKTLDLLIPGYEGSLAARYRAIPLEELTEELNRAERKRSRDPLAGTDVLIKLCETILIRDQGSGKLEPLAVVASRDGRLDDPDPEENPIRYDERLAKLLDFEEEGSSARLVVRQLFSPEDAQVAAAASHIQAIQLWLKGAIEEVDNSLLDF